MDGWYFWPSGGQTGLMHLISLFHQDSRCYHGSQNCCSNQKYDAGIVFCKMLAMLSAIILSSSHVGRAFMLVSIMEARSTNLEISAVSDLMCLGREVNDLLSLFYFPRSCKRLVCQKSPRCRLSYCCYGGKKSVHKGVCVITTVTMTQPAAQPMQLPQKPPHLPPPTSFLFVHSTAYRHQGHLLQRQSTPAIHALELSHIQQ